VRVEFHPEARAELDLSALWYEERRSGLGVEFRDAVSAALGRVEQFPAAFPLWPIEPNLGLRRVSLKRFPFALAFKAYADRISVYAVAHAKRRPLYWLSRVGPDAG
jgi:hypothetical protein